METLRGLVSIVEREFTAEEADLHNALTAEGWRIINSRVLIHGDANHSPPGWWTRRELRKAIGKFEQALAINPEGWSSMWALGKVFQRLGDHSTSLRWFVRAHELNPGQPDVAREAGLAAMDSGDPEQAVRLCESAVSSSPDDPGLVSNLALAHMLAGDDQAAIRCAEDAICRDPDDAVAATVLEFVLDVSAGRRSRPRRLCDAFPS